MTEILIFPPARRADKVRKVAVSLAGLSNPEALRYWRSTVRSLRQRLNKFGLADDQADPLLYDFHNAVQTELHRMSGRKENGGAA